MNLFAVLECDDFRLDLHECNIYWLSTVLSLCKYMSDLIFSYSLSWISNWIYWWFFNDFM